jgi:phosphatidate phosphatase APP1
MSPARQPAARPDHRIYVVARTRAQFNAWCFEQGWNARDPRLRQVIEPDTLRGLNSADVRVLDFPRGTTTSVDDWSKLIAEARKDWTS